MNIEALSRAVESGYKQFKAFEDGMEAVLLLKSSKQLVTENQAAADALKAEVAALKVDIEKTKQSAQAEVLAAKQEAALTLAAAKKDAAAILEKAKSDAKKADAKRDAAVADMEAKVKMAQEDLAQLVASRDALAKEIVSFERKKAEALKALGA